MLQSKMCLLSFLKIMRPVSVIEARKEETKQQEQISHPSLEFLTSQDGLELDINYFLRGPTEDISRQALIIYALL